MTIESAVATTLVSSIVDAGDVGAEGLEFFDDAFVAAVDVVDALDGGLARSDESGEDETGAGAKVGGLDGCAGKWGWAVDDGAVAANGDVGAHALHFEVVKKAVFENGLGNGGDAFGLRGERHVLRLHVSGEARVFFGGDVGGDESSNTTHAELQGRGFFDGNASVTKPGDDRSEVLRFTVGEGEIAIGDGPGDEERTGFDAVGDDRVFCAAERPDAADGESGCGVAFDVRAHLAEQVDEVSDFRFAGCVFKNGFTVGERRRHQNIFGSGDGDFVEGNPCAFEAAGAWGARFDIAVSGVDFCTHFFEGGEMKIDGASPDGAAAGKRDAGHASASERGPEREDGCPHGLDEFVGSDGFVDCGRGDGVIGGGEFGSSDGSAHVGEEFAHGNDVANHGDVVEEQRIGGEEAGGHGGECGVFCAADSYGAVEGFAAGDEEFIHSVLAASPAQQIVNPMITSKKEPA